MANLVITKTELQKAIAISLARKPLYTGSGKAIKLKPSIPHLQGKKSL